MDFVETTGARPPCQARSAPDCASRVSCPTTTVGNLGRLTTPAQSSGSMESHCSWRALVDPDMLVLASLSAKRHILTFFLCARKIPRATQVTFTLSVAFQDVTTSSKRSTHPRCTRMKKTKKRGLFILHLHCWLSQAFSCCRLVPFPNLAEEKWRVERRRVHDPALACGFLEGNDSGEDGGRDLKAHVGTSLSGTTTIQSWSQRTRTQVWTVLCDKRRTSLWPAPTRTW